MEILKSCETEKLEEINADLQYIIDLLETCALEMISENPDIKSKEYKGAYVFCFHISRKLKNLKEKIESTKQELSNASNEL